MPIDGGFVGMVDRDVFDEWLREARHPVRRRTAHRHFPAICARCGRRRPAEFRNPRRGRRAADDIDPRPRGDRRRRRAIGRGPASAFRARRPFVTSLPITRSSGRRNKAMPPSTARAGDRDLPGRAFSGFLQLDFFRTGRPRASAPAAPARGSPRAARSASCGRRWAWIKLRSCGARAHRSRSNRSSDGTMGGMSCSRGDAAGVVAPASGEGIYYAMASGRIVAEAVHQFLPDRPCKRTQPRAKAIHAVARRRVPGFSG